MCLSLKGGRGALGDTWVGWEPQRICGWVGSLGDMWVGWELRRCVGLVGSLRSYGDFGRAWEAFQNLKRVTKLVI